MNKWAKIGVAIVVVLTVIVAGFVIWASTPLGPMPEALAALQSDDQVWVDTESWLVFMPAERAKSTGFIFYPGGRVDPRSYAPAARAIAAAGYPAVIVPMPLNLAVFGADKADEVREAFPEITSWAIGGHSLGGAMAANYARNNPAGVDGLILWAAYPADGDDLSSSELAIASIFGTLDGVATPEEIDASRPLLPASTTWVPIDGGNHAQFGWYGPQRGDNAATISREDQQGQIVGATLALLDSLDSQT